MSAGHQPPAELRLLTGLRGLAAWWVVLYHIRQAMPWLHADIMKALSYGYLGVDFFFLLSGFVIWISAQADFATKGWSAYGPFLWRRIARIAPLYFFILGGAIMLAILLGLTGRTNPGLFAWDELPYHIAMIQAWGIVNPLRWNVPAWSISTEMAAYLLFPLLALPARFFKSNRWASAALFLLICGAIHLYFSAHNLPILGDDIWHAGLTRCLLLFSAGICIAHIWQHTRDSEIWIPVVTLLVAIVSAAAWALNIVGQTLIIPLLFGAILFLAALAARRWPSITPNWLYYAGEISYSTYLAHYLAWYAYKMAFVSDPFNVSPVLIMGFLLVILALSALLYHCVERPAQKWLRARTRGKPPFVQGATQ